MAKSVFLSYYRPNEADVRGLRDDLVAQGIDVWWDDELLPGQDWEFEIEQAMARSDYVLLCLSSAFVGSGRSGVYPELDRAIEQYRQLAPGTIYLIPVRLDDCRIPSIKINQTKALNSLQCVDLFGPERDYNLAKLVQTLAGPSEGVTASDDSSAGVLACDEPQSRAITAPLGTSSTTAPLRRPTIAKKPAAPAGGVQPRYSKRSVLVAVGLTLLLASFGGAFAIHEYWPTPTSPIPLVERYQDGLPQAKVRLGDLETKDGYQLARHASRTLADENGWFFESKPIGHTVVKPIVRVRGMPSGGQKPKVTGYIFSHAESPAELVAVGKLTDGTAQLTFTGTALPEDVVFILFSDERPFDANLQLRLTATIE